MTTDLMIAAAIAVVTLLTRLPFLTTLLFQWDSALYAQALEHGFHVSTEIAAERPHPPGYLFYVGLAWLVRLVTRDSNAALVAIAVLASALAAAAVYLLSRRFAPRVPSAVAASAFAASPLVWQQSEVGLPYTLLALFSVGLAWSLYRVRLRRADAVAITFAFGLLAGFRQDLPLLFGPLWLWSVAPLGRSVQLRALAAGAIACLVWAVPTAMLSGGFAPYLDALGGQASHVETTFSVAARGTAGLVENLAFTGYALGAGLVACGVALVVLGGARLLAVRGGLGSDGWWLVLWTVPPLAIYVGLHIGDPGYVLSILPGLYVTLAILLDRAIRDRRLLAPLGGALVLANAVLFLAGIGPFSASAVGAHDRALRGRITAVRDQIAPENAAILAQFDYVMVRYYLPEYRALFFGDSPDVLSRAALPIRLAPARDHVVLFGVTADLPSGLRRADVRPGVAELASVVADTPEATLVGYDVEHGAR